MCLWRCRFKAQKSLDFQGPLLQVAFVMDLPASKSLRPAPYLQQVHVCINSYFLNLTKNFSVQLNNYFYLAFNFINSGLYGYVKPPFSMHVNCTYRWNNMLQGQQSTIIETKIPNLSVNLYSQHPPHRFLQIPSLSCEREMVKNLEKLRPLREKIQPKYAASLINFRQEFANSAHRRSVV